MEPPTHLTLILDLPPTLWGAPPNHGPNEPLMPLSSFLSHVLAFVNSHLGAREENGITVLGAFPSKSALLFTSSSITDAAPQGANTYHTFKIVDSEVIAKIQHGLASIHEDREAPSGLVGALTKGLCHINRMLYGSTGTATGESSRMTLDATILILSVSPDISTSYIPIMNFIFAAQKLKVKIDVCKVFGEDTVFLQQAAHLTGGSYVTLRKQDSLLQYLMMCFSAPSSVREIINIPTQDRIDLRAACFCHKNIVDIGYVCSVCLSIFCSPVPVCSTCRSKFPMKTLRRFGFGLPKSGVNAAHIAAKS
ncbi:transcription factor Tfb4 [Cantharellus anzutake]|uniref:transcription factor Tfb4 n=1 Tax=Cantharellus anzutake TaxID=1750568 RepID=UPI001903EF45|nr:transcription factor Tfb4 [Cantharellus anzutake]KAF8331114.1 transcription factor Tfb4 [Cantharellus anzutake]